jgi:hypothetical protein
VRHRADHRRQRHRNVRLLWHSRALFERARGRGVGSRSICWKPRSPSSPIHSQTTPSSGRQYADHAGGSSQSFAFRCADRKLIALHLSSQEKFWAQLVCGGDVPLQTRFASRGLRVAGYVDSERRSRALPAAAARRVGGVAEAALCADQHHRRGHGRSVVCHSAFRAHRRRGWRLDDRSDMSCPHRSHTREKLLLHRIWASIRVLSCLASAIRKKRCRI